MAVAYGTKRNFAEGDGTTVGAQTKPVSTAIGDVLIAVMYNESSGAIGTPTIASTGDTWTVVHAHINTTGELKDFEFFVWICVVANSTSTVTVTWDGDSVWRDFSLYRFTGVDNTTPQDCAATENTGDNNTTATFLGVTTATAGAHLVALSCNWDGTTSGSWTAGLTENDDSGNVAMASGDQASAGASGNKTATLAATTSWITVLMALRPAGGGAVVIAEQLVNGGVVNRGLVNAGRVN